MKLTIRIPRTNPAGNPDSNSPLAPVSAFQSPLYINYTGTSSSLEEMKRLAEETEFPKPLPRRRNTLGATSYRGQFNSLCNPRVNTQIRLTDGDPGTGLSRQTSPGPSSAPLIHHLPVEILTEIFLFCLSSPSEKVSVSCSQEMPLVLSFICREWRSLALNTPRLWSSLSIRFPPARSLSVESVQKQRLGIELWLKRSGSHPLSISLTRSQGLQGLINRRESEDLDYHIFELLGPLMQRSHRITELVIFSLQSLNDFLRYLTTVEIQLSALISIHMQVEALMGPDKSRILSDIMSHSRTSMPNLQMLSIEALTSNAARYLTRTRSWSPIITQLTLGSSSYGHAGSRVSNSFLGSADILSILSQNPQLQSFQCIVTLNSPYSIHRTPLLHPPAINLPLLLNLSIRFEVPPNDTFNPFPDPDIHHLFECIACPALKILSVAYAGLPSVTEVPFISWLRGGSGRDLFTGKRPEKLRELSLEISMTPQALTECLILLPMSLRDLEIVDLGHMDIDGTESIFGHTVQDSHLELLTRDQPLLPSHRRASISLPFSNNHHSVPCPRLKTFRLIVSGFLALSCSTPRATCADSSDESHFNLPQIQGISHNALQRFVESRMSNNTGPDSGSGKSRTLRECEVLLSPTSSSYYKIFSP
ncbi:hypothetical protein GYMLUDRAFT_36810 [Collybiopsis luxurians FD-317 M1]|nr:hypothetical protein GYMLUDRAFT_36810 [Collybiopsis luxurians FD-317 M1]